MCMYMYMYMEYIGVFLFSFHKEQEGVHSGLVWSGWGAGSKPGVPPPYKSAKEDVIIKNGCFSGENNHSRLLTVHN